MIDTEIILLTRGGTLFLCFVAFWVLLSIVVIKLTFFPSSRFDEEDVEDTADENSNHEDDNEDETLQTSDEEEDFDAEEVLAASNKADNSQSDAKDKPKTWFSDESENINEPEPELETEPEPEPANEPQVETNVAAVSEAANHQPEPKSEKVSAKQKTDLFEEDASDLTNLLKSVNLEHDLKHDPNESNDNTKRHVYSTISNQDALEVGTSFADELARIGYEIEAIDYQSAKAHKTDHSLLMRIEPKAGNAIRKGTSVYPNTSHDAVVIDISLLEK